MKLTSAGGKVTAYASVLDNATNDPLLVTPVSVTTTGAPKYVLPGIADLNNGNANWRSDVRIYNPSSSATKFSTATCRMNFPRSRYSASAPRKLASLAALIA